MASFFRLAHFVAFSQNKIILSLRYRGRYIAWKISTPILTNTKKMNCEVSIENLPLPKAGQSLKSRSSAPKAIMMIALLSILSIFGISTLQAALNLNNFVGDDNAQAQGITVVDRMTAESSLTSTFTDPNQYLAFDSQPEQEGSKEGVEEVLENKTHHALEAPSDEDADLRKTIHRTADEPTNTSNLCKHVSCRQADPPGSARLGRDRGLALLLPKHNSMRRYNLAYLFVPKAGSSTMKDTLKSAGKTEKIWLSSPINGTSTLDPKIFTLMRDPGERVASAYSTILARYNGRFSSNKFPEPPGNTTDAAAPEWKEHFQKSISMMMRSVKENGWNNASFVWNVHIVPQVEFMRGLNVSHIGCVGSINETLTKLDLMDDGKKVERNQYEHNDKMPSKKFGSYAILSVESKKLIREVYEEDYALFESLCANK